MVVANFLYEKSVLKHALHEHLVAGNPRPGSYHFIECAMKGFCEWFRDMPIMA